MVAASLKGLVVSEVGGFMLENVANIRAWKE